ncbi:MAG: tyrosine-type recombinase/integrase [Ruthenibacterium sp.]
MQPKSKDLTFNSELAPWLYAFFEEKHRLGYKYKGIDALLMSFDKFLLDKDCKNGLSKELVLQWTQRKPHQKAETARCSIRTMRVFADFLNRNGIPAYRVSRDEAPRRTHDFTPYIFTYEEIERILAVVDGFHYNKTSPNRHLVYPLLIRILCFCGLRVSEALNLKVKDVDFEKGYFILRETKNRQDRMIPLDENLRGRFNAYREQMGFKTTDEYFFPAPDGFIYGIDTIEKTFRDAMFAAGIPYRGRGKGPRLHDLRHTFAVHSLQKLTQNGKPSQAALPILMMYLGHKSVDATSRYIHLAAESYPALLKQTEAAFGDLIPWEEHNDDETD